MLNVLAIAFPFFAVIAFGFMAGRFAIIAKTDSAALNRFVFMIAMPVALFGLTAQSAPVSLADLQFALIYLIAGLVTLLGAYFLARKFFRLSRPDAGVHAFATTLGNAVFLGLPIAQSIAGWGRAYVILMLIEGIIIMTIGSVLIAGRVDEASIDRGAPLKDIAMRPLKNPLVMGALGGFLFSLTTLTLPEPIANFLSLLGRAAGPTALFSLGLFLAAAPIARNTILTATILHIALFKLVFLPGLAFVGLHLFAVTDPLIVGPMMLFTLVPSGIVVYISASNRGHYEKEAATAIGVTTVLSILTISGVLYFYA